MNLTFALIQGIEEIAARDPKMYEILRDLRQAINNETARVQSGSATLSSGRALVACKTLALGAVVSVWFAVEDPTLPAGDVLTAPPTMRLTGRQFTILSSNSTDTSRVEWLVVNP
jgi:hypothetical protein